MIDLKNTYIENDFGELRDLYVNECRNQFSGIVISSAFAYNEAYIMLIDGIGLVDGRIDEISLSKLNYITLSDLKPKGCDMVMTKDDDVFTFGQKKWSNELPPCDTFCAKHFNGSVEKIKPILYHEESDGIIVMFYQEPSGIYGWCYTGNCTFHPIETPEQKAAKEREIELHEIAEFMRNDKSPSGVQSIYNYITHKGYRKPE